MKLYKIPSRLPPPLCEARAIGTHDECLITAAGSKNETTAKEHQPISDYRLRHIHRMDTQTSASLHSPRKDPWADHSGPNT